MRLCAALKSSWKQSVLSVSGHWLVGNLALVKLSLVSGQWPLVTSPGLPRSLHGWDYGRWLEYKATLALPEERVKGEVSKAIGRGGFNIRLAGQLTGYEIDVYREGMEEDVELTEFSDEIEVWIIEEFKKAGLDTAKSVLEQDIEDLVKRTDLEEETIQDVRKVLSAEFSNE